jgi:iron complex outermembrane receptor protein
MILFIRVILKALNNEFILLLLLSSVALAENTANPETDLGVSQDSATTQLEAIEVIDSAMVADLPISSTVLQGDALKLQQADTLGKTLENQMGVANASFGPGVGAPVIRGLTGSRVRIMQDGIGSHDASFLSPDHAVAIEPLFAEEIKVVRGPDTVRYGGNAIGGMVDVKDNRIPERVPENWVGGAAESRFDTNGDGTNSAFKLDLGKDAVAFRLGGFYRSRNDTEIPGEAIDSDAVEQQFGLSNIINAYGTIPNTDSESMGGSLGLSWLGDTGMAGMAVSHLTNQYGVPKGTHGIDPSHLDGLELILPDIDPDLLDEFADILGPNALNPDIRIDMEQTRYDFKSEWYPGIPAVDRVKFRYGLVDYTHTEFEGSLPFTTFDNQVGEGRFEIDHKWFENFTGTFGTQWQERDFSALGVETFVPQTRGDTLGFFTVQTFKYADLTFEAGLRTERSRIDPVAEFLKFPAPPGQPPTFPNVALPDQLTFRADSASLSTSWDMTGDAALVLALSRAKRAPDMQELLALGPHLSTRTFEVGNVDLGNETVNLVDLGLDWHAERLAAKINGYYNWTEDYIYQKRIDGFYSVHQAQFYPDCVSLVDCLPIYAYDQRDAWFVGYEAEAQATVADTGYGQLKLTLFSDYVRGRFADGEGGDVPRMPPLRFGAELGFGDQIWNTALRYTRAEAQSRPGEGETATAGYHLLSASADYHWKNVEPLDLWLFAKANNLLNEEIRSSVSFLRNFAPEPGRSVVIGFRATF